jgi:hypothetical protein
LQDQSKGEHESGQALIVPAKRSVDGDPNPFSGERTRCQET